MKKFLVLILALVMPMLLVAQERVISKELPNFKKVELSGKMNVKFVRDTKNSFELKLKGIGSDKLDWGIKNEKLYINLRGSSKNATADITIYFVEIDNIIAMASNVIFEQGAKFEMLDMKLVSGAEMDFNGTIGCFTLKATGNSTVNLSGECDYLSINAVHSNVKASTFEAISARVEASTGSEVIVNADEHLEVSAVGASTVFYLGKPKYLIIKSTTLNSKTNIISLDRK